MPEAGFKRKLAAILSADVEGYSRLMDDDEEATVCTLKTYRAAINDLVQQYRGRIVDSPGDNILAEFNSVVDAVNCAVEIQRDLAERNAELAYSRKMDFRIGINLGDVIEDDGNIYGDGVNIAARVESLAEAGGICISGRAYDQILNKLGLEYENLGEHQVKNISVPIRVYRVLSHPGAAAHRVVQAKEGLSRKWRKTIMAAAVVILVVGGLAYWQFYVRRPTVEPASIENMAYPLPEKPSIAVLPFDNMSGDPDQEFFSDGITEEIITSISKTDQLFVIARNSSFTYKGKPVNVKQVAEDLGVRYVLEGSVRKSQSRVRITAQLIDAISGHHIWAERYDRDLKEIFALQDEITKNIVTSLGVKLQEGDHLRISAERTEDLDYLLKYMKALSNINKGSPEAMNAAGKIGKELIEKEPNNPDGYVILGWHHLLLVMFGFSPKENGAKAYQMAKKAISLDELDSLSHTLLSGVYLMMRQHNKAIAEAERAIALSPNNAYAYQQLGIYLSYASRLDEAIEKTNQAIRLDPFPNVWKYLTLGRCYMLKQQYEKALMEYNKAFQVAPDNTLVLISLTAAYSTLDREGEAREKAKKLLELDPNYSLNKMARTSMFKNPTDLNIFSQGLRKAGIPETQGSSIPEKPSIAVLPFDNLSDDKEQEYFSDGMTDDIITDLSKIKDVLVISRNSTFTYKGKEKKIPEIAKELNVRYILEGSVRRAGNQVRINAQLIDAKTDHHLWAERFDDTFRNIFKLQDKITDKIVTALVLKLSSSEEQIVADKGTVNTAAYDAYLKGMIHKRRFTPDDYVKAISYFKQAIELDPGYSQAYAELAHTYWIPLKGGKIFWDKIGDYRTCRIRARHYLEIAMKKPTSRAYQLMARMELFKRNFDNAIDLAGHAVSIAPNDADAMESLGNILVWTGSPEGAIEYYQKSIMLDPLYKSTNGLGFAYFTMGDFEKAVKYIEKALKDYPNAMSGYGALAATYGFLGNEMKAKAAFKKFYS